MLVKDILQTPIMCTPDKYIQEVVELMTQNNVFYIPVVESLAHKNPIGVVTEKSICRRSIAQGLNPLNMTADRVMNSNYKIVTPNTSLENCRRIMQSCKVRYLLVTDENNVCCGIVTLDDILEKLNNREEYLPLNEISNQRGQLFNLDRIF